ncbi:MAG: hypothetical protein L0Y44_15145 [Phycisphaerales bacterium]|nr:hypothetical protein [Phycisphaerales bacterium]
MKSGCQHRFLFAVVVLVFGGCQSSQHNGATSSTTSTLNATATTTAPLFAGMGDHHRAITASSKQAQKYFDQGLAWTFAFNHDEAIRSFKQTAELDPKCAMAYWGISYCHGPHINNPVMDEAHVKAAWEALQQAQALRGGASPVEQDLIDALAKRYSADPKADRAPMNKAYADAMAAVYREYPKDTDVGALYAESLMDLRPWDLWSLDDQPRPETPFVVAALERVLTQDSRHPLANHLYIHAVEAGPNPEKAVDAANRLRKLVPGSGHLVHMPAHIDIRTGQWAMAAKQNQEAIEIDREYREISPRQGFYHVYMAHNHQFLSFASMMRGRREESNRAARNMVAGVPSEFIETSAAMIDGYLPIYLEAMVRFGMWNEILQEPAPDPRLPITTAFWRFTRAIALAALGKLDEAVQEQALFRKAVEAIPKDAVMAINPAHKVLSIADHVLNGEIAFRKREIDTAVRELTEAVNIEDTLLYMEPPDWLVPVRHTLGAVLMSAGRTAEAEDVYRTDLKYWPENGWALFGLWKSLEAQSDPEAPSIKRRFEKVWAGADTPLTSTCLCVAKAH